MQMHWLGILTAVWGWPAVIHLHRALSALYVVSFAYSAAAVSGRYDVPAPALPSVRGDSTPHARVIRRPRQSQSQSSKQMGLYHSAA
jgi:hypothetical protein